VLHARFFEGLIPVERISVLFQAGRSSVVAKLLGCLLCGLADEQVFVPAKLFGTVRPWRKHRDDDLIVLAARHEALNAPAREVYLIIEVNDFIVLVPQAQNQNIVLDRLAFRNFKDLTPGHRVIINQVLFVVNPDAVTAAPRRLPAFASRFFKVNGIFAVSRCVRLFGHKSDLCTLLK